MSGEHTAKLTARPELQLPNLNSLIDEVTMTPSSEDQVDDTYYDTAQLDLIRDGATLRYRVNHDGGRWILRLPGGRTKHKIAHELTFEGLPNAIPAGGQDLVSSYVRSRPLAEVARLKTSRSSCELQDATGQRLAKIVDARTHAYRTGAPQFDFREIDITINSHGRATRQLSQTIIDRLEDAGFYHAPQISKIVRVLGEQAQQPPECAVPPINRHATLELLVQRALARSVTQILSRDPGVRLGEDPREVHQFRVAVRRLRADLHTFRSLLQRASEQKIREELAWLGSAVGAVRDCEVLDYNLRTQALTLAETDVDAVQQLLSHLDDEERSARTSLLCILRSSRYLALLEMLIKAVNEPPWYDTHTDRLRRPATHVATTFIDRPWRRLSKAVAQLDDHPTDAALHHIRILSKQCRYAAEAIAPINRNAIQFAAAVTNLQTVLGEHQDAVVAEAWLRSATESSPEVALVAGELIVMQRLARATARAEWPKAWKVISSKKQTRWLG